MNKHKKEEIYFRKNNSINGETIIFVHGLSGSSSAWMPYEKKLNKMYNIISLDLRGHGKSFRPKKLKDYSIRLFSNDIYNLAKKEKLSKFILVSHSFGNLITLDFAKKHQKMLKALILISPDAAPKKIRSAFTLYPLIYLTKLIDYFPSIKNKGIHVDYTQYLNTGDWNVRRFITDVKNTGIKSFLFSMAHAYNFDIENFLSKIKIPILIIHGDKDTIFPVSSGIKINNLIKKSKLIILNECDHIIVLNNFNKVYNEINKFLESLK